MNFYSSVINDINNYLNANGAEVVFTVLNFVSFIVFWFLYKTFWSDWVEYIRRATIFKEERVLLEIKLPKIINKTPVAMEIFMNSLCQPFGEATWVDRWWKGSMRPNFSLEIVSVGGEVKFLIWAPKGARAGIETTLYSQFPDIEIHEIPDYTKDIFYNKDKNDLWGQEYKLSKADPYPIKTYVDYGLEDASMDDELRVDPLATLLENFGAIGLNDNAWMQIIIRAHKKEDKDVAKFVWWNPSTWFAKTDKWKDDSKKEIEEIIKKALFKGEEGAKVTGSSLSKLQKETVEALERSVSKSSFDAGIRMIYTAPKESYNKSIQGAIGGSLKHFGSPHLNGFEPNKHRGVFEYPWQDSKKKKQNKIKEEILEAYKRRGWFYPPVVVDKFVLNTEELATLYHFPSSLTATAPSVPRIQSKRTNAPTNLPI